MQIVYFADQGAYLNATQQPEWSKGFSISHLASVNLRMIISYRGQKDFLSTVLPHEIGHLILHDFVKGRKIPVWFDEGLAQLEEENNSPEHKTIVARLAVSGKTIPLEELNGYEAKAQSDPMQAAIFYAESLYIVDFLVKTYGKSAFTELCRQLRDGAPFDHALRVAYYPTITSMAALQGKWRSYMADFVQASPALPGLI